MEFTLKTKIKSTAEEIYKAWLDSEGHTKIEICDLALLKVTRKEL